MSAHAPPRLVQGQRPAGQRHPCVQRPCRDNGLHRPRRAFKNPGRGRLEFRAFQPDDVSENQDVGLSAVARLRVDKKVKPFKFRARILFATMGLTEGRSALIPEEAVGRVAHPRMGPKNPRRSGYGQLDGHRGFPPG